MDKRFKPLSAEQQLDQRMALIADIEAQPGMPLGDAVRLVRTRLHLTQPEFAKLTKVAVRTLMEIEAGRGNPSLATSDKLLSPMGLKLGVVPRT
jgi:XRE family transcriptional regulator, regulator of sulfur utilization